MPVIAGDGSDPRSGPRSNVFLMAVLSAGPGACPVRVRNLSERGALLEGSGLPTEGATVQIKRGSLWATGEVAWQSDRQCGVRFHCALDVEEWVKRAGPVGQQRIDFAVAEHRGRDPSPSRQALLPGNDDQDILEKVSSELLKTCERIAALPGMSIELAEELLKVEAAAHRIKAMARIKR